MSELDRKLVRGSAWLALSYGGGQIITFVITAVLARLVSPAAFGLVALASIAIVALTLLQESGLSAAVIYRRADLEEASASAFVFTAVMGFVLYGIAFAVAPLVAELFSQPHLTSVMRVLMLMLPVRALGLVPGALIERELAFDARAKGEVAGVLLQALTAIPLAVAGLGVWSIVASQVAGQAAQSILFWVWAPHRPSPRLASWRMLRELGRYGRHITAGNIVALIDGNIDTAVVGRLLTAANVGYYSMAWRLSNLPATGLAYIIGRVMFPAYATLQHDLPVFREVFLTNLRRVGFTSLPLAVGIFLAADPIVIGIFGARWHPAVGALKILAVFGLIRSFAGATGAVFQAAGRPQLVFLLNVLHLAVLCPPLFLLVPSYGIEGAAGAATIAAFVSLVGSYVFVFRILELSLGGFLANLGRPAIAAVPVIAALAALELSTRDLQSALQLILIIVGGLLVYASALYVFGRSELKTIGAAFRS